MSRRQNRRENNARMKTIRGNVLYNSNIEFFSVSKNDAHVTFIYIRLQIFFAVSWRISIIRVCVDKTNTGNTHLSRKHFFYVLKWRSIGIGIVIDRYRSRSRSNGRTATRARERRRDATTAGASKRESDRRTYMVARGSRGSQVTPLATALAVFTTMLVSLLPLSR